MCRPATCRTCGKATYAGCGQHVEQVLSSVPRNQRCSCTPADRKGTDRSLIARMFGR